MTNEKWATIAIDIDCAGLNLETSRWHFEDNVTHLDHLAGAGYVEASKERVALFAKYLREGLPIPRDHFERLCDWLDQIAKGEDPAKVLGFGKRKGRKPSIDKIKKYQRIAHYIDTYIRVGGLTLEEAIAALTDETAKEDFKNRVSERSPVDDADVGPLVFEMADIQDEIEKADVQGFGSNVRELSLDETLESLNKDIEEFGLLYVTNMIEKATELFDLSERSSRLTLEEMIKKISSESAKSEFKGVFHMGMTLQEISETISGNLEMGNLREREVRLAWEVYGAYKTNLGIDRKKRSLNLKPLKNTSKRRDTHT